MKKKDALERIVALLKENNTLLNEIAEFLAPDKHKPDTTESEVTAWEVESTVNTAVSERGADIFNDDWPGGQ